MDKSEGEEKRAVLDLERREIESRGGECIAAKEATQAGLSLVVNIDRSATEDRRTNSEGGGEGVERESEEGPRPSFVPEFPSRFSLKDRGENLRFPSPM